MFRVADVVVVMADNPLREIPADPSVRVIRTRLPGPSGILEVLLTLPTPEAAGGLGESR
jgi:hypothetical protein